MIVRQVLKNDEESYLKVELLTHLSLFDYGSSISRSELNAKNHAYEY